MFTPQLIKVEDNSTFGLSEQTQIKCLALQMAVITTDKHRSQGEKLVLEHARTFEKYLLGG